MMLASRRREEGFPRKSGRSEEGSPHRSVKGRATLFQKPRAIAVVLEWTTKTQPARVTTGVNRE